MKCPYCGDVNDRVIDSREGQGGDVIRRRRECLACHRRFTSYERIEEAPAMVVKKDGRRELFDRRKLMDGLLKSCSKRPVSPRALEDLVDEISVMVAEAPDREMSTEAIGRRVMDGLRELDKVAYVRFASVYRRFADVEEFLDELRSLVGPGAAKKREGR